MSVNKDFLPSSSPISSICAVEIEVILFLFMVNRYKSSFQECITIIVLKIEGQGTSRHIVYFSYKEKMDIPAFPGWVVLGLPSPSPRVCTDVRWRLNQNFSVERVYTKFAYPWCSVSSAIIRHTNSSVILSKYFYLLNLIIRYLLLVIDLRIR